VIGRRAPRMLVAMMGPIALLATTGSSPAADAPRRSETHGTPSGGDMTCAGPPGGCEPLPYLAGAHPVQPVSLHACSPIFPVRPALATLWAPTIMISRPLPAQALGGAVRQIRVANGPVWTHWAVWDDQGGALLLTDVATHSIFHFALSTGIVKQVVASEFDSGTEVNPSAIRADDTGYILQDTKLGRLIWLDRSYSQTHFLQLTNLDLPDTGTIGPVRAWLAA
jgi:hypothetical protein